jgi:hypothetical protein
MLRRVFANESDTLNLLYDFISSRERGKKVPLTSTVSRWYFCVLGLHTKKITLCVCILGRAWNIKCCPFGNFLRLFGTLDDHLVHWMAIWYIGWPFGTVYGLLVYFAPVLVCCSMKNLATPLTTWAIWFTWKKTGDRHRQVLLVNLFCTYIHRRRQSNCISMGWRVLQQGLGWWVVPPCPFFTPTRSLRHCRAGLPDGLFSNQKRHFG